MDEDPFEYIPCFSLSVLGRYGFESENGEMWNSEEQKGFIPEDTETLA